MRRLVSIALFACAVPACLDDGTGGEVSELADGSREAVGVLRFLNSAAADERTLDIDAALDARAARNIAAHVRGADGVFGTADDDRLADVAELDAIAYVGESAIDKLVVYVRSIGGVPELDVEGVLLTAAEARAIVAAAGGATLAELDDTAGLDARAARNLIAGRPYADIHAVAAVGYVGSAALEKLRMWAPTWTPPVAGRCDPQLLAGMRACVERQLADDTALSIDAAAEICGDAELLGPVFDAVCAGPLPPGFCAGSYEAFYTTAVPPCREALDAQLMPTCRTSADCGAFPMRCVGTTNDGSSSLGLCADMTRVPGAGNPCATESACPTGTVCAGLTLGGNGICVSSWMSGTYETEVPVPIAAASGATVTSPIVVIGQATVPMDVEVSVDLAGVDPRRIRLTLSESHGDAAVIWNGEGAVLPARMNALGEISRDRYINGRWTLTVTNLATGTSGILRGWQLHLTSRWD